MNKATAKLYPVANTPERFMPWASKVVGIHQDIGLYNSKAKTLSRRPPAHGTAWQEVPHTRERWKALPGES